MPKKRKAPTANLGAYAKKRPRNEEPNEPRSTTLDSASDCSRPSTPDSFMDVAPGDDHASIGSSASTESVISVDLGPGDVPKFQSDNTLLCWLKLGKKKLKALRGKLGSSMSKKRGPYYKSQLGAAPAERTVRLHNAQKRDTLQKHGGGILGYLTKPSETDSVLDLSDDESDAETVEEESRMQCRPAAPRHTAVTVEEIDDKDDDRSSLAPSELSRLEEDGLQDIDAILAAAAYAPERLDDEESAPQASAHSPAVPPGPHHTPSTADAAPRIRFGPLRFTRTDDTFKPTESSRPAFGGQPPAPAVIDETIRKLHTILRPPRGPHTRGYKYANLNIVLRVRLELMLNFLRLYRANKYKGWGNTADTIAKAAGNGAWMSRRIREWTLAFIKDENLPHTEYGKFNVSVLEDEDLAQELTLHLQSLGEYISAQDVADYVNSDEMKKRLNLKHGISTRTARRWMKQMEYRWTAEPKGMYKDGHERQDVVDYRQNKFLPLWAEYAQRTRRWTKAGREEGKDDDPTAEGARPEPKKTKRRREEENLEVWEEETKRVFVAVPDGTGHNTVFASNIWATAHGMLRAMSGPSIFRKKWSFLN